MILGCVAAFVGFIVLAFGVLLWKKRRLQAGQSCLSPPSLVKKSNRLFMSWKK